MICRDRRRINCLTMQTGFLYHVNALFAARFKKKLMTENLRRRIHEKKLLVVEAMDIYFGISDGGPVHKHNDVQRRCRVRRTSTDRDCQSSKCWGCQGKRR